MKEIFDVVISGAGPSGSILGYLLSNKGYKVLMIDKEKFPRYKVCAGGIQVKATELIPYKVESMFHQEIRKIFFSRKLKDVFLREYDEPLIYTIERFSFDNYLMRKAVVSGCIVRFLEKVKEVEIENKGVYVHTDKNRYYGKIFVGCDGSNGFTIKHFNNYKNIRKIIGYEIEIPVSSFADDKLPFSKVKDANDLKNIALFDKNCMVLDFGGIKYGYLWFFPKREKISAGIGGLPKDSVKIKRYLNYFIKETSLCKIKNNFDFKIYAHFIPVRRKNDFISSFRVLAAGDAAGFGDGFTGEGLHNAILSSHLAFGSIDKALRNSSFGFSDYYEKVKAEIIRNIDYSIMISKIFFSSQYFYYKLIKNNENLFKSCCKVLRGEKTYKDVVNRLRLIKI